jgi:hypothetical protein
MLRRGQTVPQALSGRSVWLKQASERAIFVFSLVNGGTGAGIIGNEMPYSFESGKRPWAEVG